MSITCFAKSECGSGKWDCKYHLVWYLPPRCARNNCTDIRPRLGRTFHALTAMKDCHILEGHLMPDHVHMLIEIPPKYQVSAVVGFLKGKSAIAIARKHGKQRNFLGEHF